MKRMKQTKPVKTRRHDAASLANAGRGLATPFALALEGQAPGEAAEITVREILRHLPGRRIAGLADWGGRTVFFKAFLGKQAPRAWRRELEGLAAIAATGVPAPALLWQGGVKGGGLLLLCERIKAAQSLEAAWRAGAAGLQDAVMATLARLHSAGVRQRDIHLDNFLLGAEEGRRRLYLVDGGQVVQAQSGALSASACIGNLARFLAQFPQAMPLDLEAALASYCRHRGWPRERAPLEALLRQLARQRQARKRIYLGKAYRNCTRFVCEASWRRFQVCAREWDSPALRAFLANLDGAILGGALLKDGNSCTVAAVESPIGRLAIKRYNIKSPLHRLRRLFRPSRAWRVWRSALLLEFTGIRTPAPVAMIEERFGPLRGRAWYVSRLEEAPDARQVPSLRGKARQAAISEAAALLRLLGQAGD